MLRTAKAKTARGKRELEKRAPQLEEDEKNLALLSGTKTSLLVTSVMREFYLMKKPHAVRYSKKNPIRPFEDAAGLEFITVKAQAALFMLGMHSKKRPHTLVFGRTFDGHVLDMFELSVVGYTPQADFEGPYPTVGNHPLVIFQGGDWETGSDLPVLRNLFLDLFRGAGHGGELDLAGVERVVALSAVEGIIYLRQYMLELKNAGVRTPNVQLREVGPRIAFTLGRTAVADEDARRAACETIKAPKLPKNVEQGVVGERLGRVHLQRQDLGELERKTRLPKALRKRTADERESSRKRVHVGGTDGE